MPIFKFLKIDSLSKSKFSNSSCLQHWILEPYVQSWVTAMSSVVFNNLRNFIGLTSSVVISPREIDAPINSRIACSLFMFIIFPVS